MPYIYRPLKSYVFIWIRNIQGTQNVFIAFVCVNQLAIFTKDIVYKQQQPRRVRFTAYQQRPRLRPLRRFSFLLSLTHKAFWIHIACMYVRVCLSVCIFATAHGQRALVLSGIIRPIKDNVLACLPGALQRSADELRLMFVHNRMTW